MTLIKSGDYDAARKLKDSGRMFHTLQDFYSHSNWIENGNEAPNPVLGQPGQRIENIASPTQQTCLDNCVLKRGKYNKYLNYYDCHNNIVESLKINKILTSGYVSDSMDSEGKEIKKNHMENAAMEGLVSSTKVKIYPPEVASIRIALMQRYLHTTTFTRKQQRWLNKQPLTCSVSYAETWTMIYCLVHTWVYLKTQQKFLGLMAIGRIIYVKNGTGMLCCSTTGVGLKVILK